MKRPRVGLTKSGGREQRRVWEREEKRAKEEEEGVNRRFFWL